MEVLPILGGLTCGRFIVKLLRPVVMLQCNSFLNWYPVVNLIRNQVEIGAPTSRAVGLMLFYCHYFSVLAFCCQFVYKNLSYFIAIVIYFITHYNLLCFYRIWIRRTCLID